MKTAARWRLPPEFVTSSIIRDFPTKDSLNAVSPQRRRYSSIQFLRCFMHQLPIQRMAHRGDLSRLDRAQHGAARLIQVAAIIKPAMAEIGRELGNRAFQHAFR